MIIKRKDFEIVIGKAIGHIIEEILINTSKRIWIISPWISEKYADFLIKQKEKNLDVKLIISNDKINEDAIEKLVEEKYEFKYKNKKRIALKILLACLILFSFSFAFSSFDFVLKISLIPIFSLAIFYIVYLLLKKELIREPKIDLTIVDKVQDFTHLKIYLLDNIAILTSANFTDSGLWRNYELAIIIKNEKIVEKIEKYFEQLKNNVLISKVNL